MEGTPPAALPLTKAERKRMRDQNRKRGGKKMKKRLHVLNNPAKMAFRGWEDEPQPWKYSTCEEFIEWCHITKLFPHERHRNHRVSDKANLTFCHHAEFVERCIQVYQHLYNLRFVERNEAPLFICRMVYAEVVLHKVVDWSTIKTMKSVTMPRERDIPKQRVYADGGLGRKMRLKPQEKEPETEESEPDSDSDGRRGERVPRRVAAPANMAVVPPIHHPEDVAEPHVDENMNIMDNVPNPADELEVGGIEPTVVVGMPVLVRGNETIESNELGELQLKIIEKDGLIAELQETIRKLQLESARKDAEVIDLRNQLQEREKLQPSQGNDLPVVQDPMLVDESYINNTIDVATSGVLENISTPAKRRRVGVVLPPLGPHARPYVDIDGPLSQDSLSFPTTAQTEEVETLRRANDELRLLVSKFAKTHYEWKVATILNVDRSRQMAIEFKKIDEDYLTHNKRRNFGLTSWANAEDMFPSNMPMQETNSSLIDWAKLDFDHENATSCHDLQMKPQVKSRKLWPNPQPWVLDGSVTCMVCLNPFGPEGGWALGSCTHMFHPMCLINIFLVRRFCPVCKSPFHERLYEVFGLTPYMPPSHERNPLNTEGECYRNQWGEDLLWSWRANTHSTFKNDISASLGWENDHKEIVRVCKKLIGSAPSDQGKRNFFYQTLDGYWDANNNRFQFGTHPQGLIWDKDGKLITNNEGHATMSAREAVQMDLSEWKELWKNEAVDFLLEEHSPQTLRTLAALRSSQILRSLSETDGPFKRTRSTTRRPILLDDGAGPSGTAGVDADD